MAKRKIAAKRKFEVRNPVFNGRGGIDCEIKHPKFGWIPFSAQPDDPEPHGREIYAACLAMNPDPDAAKPPPDPRDFASLPRAHLCKALRQAGVLSIDEAVTAAQGGWPATFAAFASGLSEDDAADAQIDWAAANLVGYRNPIVQHLALTHAGGDQTQATAILDAMFGID